MAKVRTGPKTRKKVGGPRLADGGPRADKVAAVAAIRERLAAGPALLTDYRGLTVKELADLRRVLAGAAEVRVVKNTLATIAAREAGLKGLLPMLEGPTAIAFVTGDLARVAKDLADFARRAPALEMKGGVLDGAVLSAEQARALATLESREVMLARVASMAVAPLQHAANAFAAGFAQLGSALAQYRDKLAAAEAA